MSIVTTKLDYARIRNAQRKVNKSVYEFKDSTNIHNNESSRSEIQELTTDPSTKKGLLTGKEEESQNTDDFANLFGQNFNNGNLEYVTSLISTQKSAINNNRNRSNPKGRNHMRAKSTFMGSSNKSKIDQSNNNENTEPSINIPSTSIQNVTSGPNGFGTTQASSLKPDIDYESTIFQIEIEKEPTPRYNFNNFSSRNPNNTPAIKEERLFDNFFKKGGLGLMRRSMSLEDLRLEKRGGPAVIDEEKSLQGYSPEGSKLSGEKNSDQSHRPNASLTSRGDFMANLNSYISYFDKSEEISLKEKQKMVNKYFVNQDGKANQFLKKELEVAQNEVRGMKRQMEGLQSKITDLVKMNKHLIKELNDVKIREEEYQQRIIGIEGQFLQLNQRKEHYKGKYFQTQELLDMERMDNENNLVMLKKMLANNIHHAMDSKMGNYNVHQREKPGREKDQLKNILKEVLQQTKNKDIMNMTNMTRVKEKKVPLSMHNNNRYDPQYNKKQMKTKDLSKYNISTISQKAGLRSEDDDYMHDENNDPSEVSARYGNIEDSEDDDVYHKHFSSEDYEKKLTKEQQIRLLQDKLAELAGGQDQHQFNYEKGIHQKSVHKTKHKPSEPNIQNYFGIREKEKEKERKMIGYSKMSNLPMRYDHQFKHKNRIDMENEIPSEAMNNFRSQNDSD